MMQNSRLNSFVYALFTQTWKKHLQETRKCLIFSVDQPGLEPVTSRLWVRENDILWNFIIIYFADSQVFSIFAVVCDTLSNPVSKSLCFPIVFPIYIGNKGVLGWKWRTLFSHCFPKTEKITCIKPPDYSKEYGKETGHNIQERKVRKLYLRTHYWQASSKEGSGHFSCRNALYYW